MLFCTKMCGFHLNHYLETNVALNKRCNLIIPIIIIHKLVISSMNLAKITRIIEKQHIICR